MFIFMLLINDCDYVLKQKNTILSYCSPFFISEAVASKYPSPEECFQHTDDIEIKFLNKNETVVLRSS